MSQVISSTPSLTDPVDVLARTLWGEARGEGREGLQAVANVVLNRVQHPCWWGDSIVSVCLAPWQFSSWHDFRGELLSVTGADPQFVLSLTIADDAINGRLVDNTGGADSYYAVYIDPPPWVKDAQFTKQIGNQRFYKVQLK